MSSSIVPLLFIVVLPFEIVESPAEVAEKCGLLVDARLTRTREGVQRAGDSGETVFVGRDVELIRRLGYELEDGQLCGSD